MDKKTEITDISLKKKLLRIILFIAYPAYVLHSLVFSPLYTVLYSDIGVNPVFHVILYYLLVLIDLFVFFTSFAVMIYGMCRYSPDEIKSIFILIFLLPIFKYVLKILISPFIDGIPTLDLLIIDLFSYGVSALLEIIQFVIVFLFSLSPARRYRDHRATVTKAAARIGSELPESLALVPFKKPISFRNPLQRGAFISAVVIIVGRVFSLAMSDLDRNWNITGINGYLSFFAPYLIETIVGCIGYFFMLYVYITVYSKTEKS